MSQWEWSKRNGYNDALLLGGEMLCKHLYAMLGFEFTNESRVPQLAGDAQVFATPHQRIAFARLGSRGNARRIEVLLFSSRDRDQPGQQ